MDTATIPFWDYWFFHIPNYLLAALLYTLLGRFTLGLFVPVDWPNYIWRGFRFLTDWALDLTRWVAPAVVPYAVLPLVASFWIVVLRAAFGIAMTTAGLAPQLQPVAP